METPKFDSMSVSFSVKKQLNKTGRNRIYREKKICSRKFLILLRFSLMYLFLPCHPA